MQSLTGSQIILDQESTSSDNSFDHTPTRITSLTMQQMEEVQSFGISQTTHPDLTRFKENNLLALRLSHLNGDLEEKRKKLNHEDIERRVKELTVTREERLAEVRNIQSALQIQRDRLEKEQERLDITEHKIELLKRIEIQRRIRNEALKSRRDRLKEKYEAHIESRAHLKNLDAMIEKESDTIEMARGEECRLRWKKEELKSDDSRLQAQLDSHKQAMLYPILLSPTKTKSKF